MERLDLTKEFLLWTGVASLSGAGGSFAVCVFRGGGRGLVLSRWLSLPSMQWIGKRSYGLYLWHWPMFEIGRLLPNETLVAFVGFALTFLAAQLSYRYIETPFLRLKDRRLRSTSPCETDCRNVADAIGVTDTV